jgi:hypothetical protein
MTSRTQQKAPLHGLVEISNAQCCQPTTSCLQCYQNVLAALAFMRSGDIRVAHGADEIAVRRQPDEVRLEIADDGRGAGSTTDAEGSGLRGLRERLIVSLACRIADHLDELLNTLRHNLSNARVEGLNTRIRLIATSARCSASLDTDSR